jgi:excisionase family DNA binding protein
VREQIQTSTGTENSSYEAKELLDLVQRIKDFHARFGYRPKFDNETGQATPADKRPEPEALGYWNAQQAAAYLDVHPDTLRKWVRQGLITRIPLPGGGKDHRFSKKILDDFMESRTLKARS